MLGEEVNAKSRRRKDARRWERDLAVGGVVLSIRK